MDYSEIITNIIMNQEEPFWISDILNKLHNIGYYDDHTVIKIVNKLYEEGQLLYDKVGNDLDNNCGFAFLSTNYFKNDEQGIKKHK